MVDELDAVANYCKAMGFTIRDRTVLVEGTTDVELFQLAARLEFAAGGLNLLGTDLAILAPGSRDLGGTRGVGRELMCLRGLARACLLPNGRPRYRFVGLFDNDKAGRQTVKSVRDWDTSILEYKDVFRLWPVMPTPNNLDTGSMEKAFAKENACYKGMEWELEDLLPQGFMEIFMSDYPQAIARTVAIEGKVHRDLTSDGKARLHRFVKQNAIRDDLIGVIEVLKAMRFYMNLK